MDDTRISTREAAIELGMDANTLRKYARIVRVAPALVAHDRKLHTYSADDLRVIGERYADDTRKRRQRGRPFPALPAAPSADAYADLQRSVSELAARVARLEAERTRVVLPPIPAPAPALVPLSVRPTPSARHRLSALPPGMMSRTEVADRHTFPRTTLIGWCRDGRVETSPETYGGEYGQFRVERPVTTRGLAQFYQRAIQRRDFTPCKECPHAYDEAAHSSGTA